MSASSSQNKVTKYGLFASHSYCIKKQVEITRSLYASLQLDLRNSYKISF